MPSRAFDSPLEFDSITGTYTLTNGVATTRDLLYTSRAMKVAIAGDYGLPTAPDEPRHDDQARPRRAQGQGDRHRRLAVDPRLAGQRSSATSIREKAQKGIQDLLKRFGR